MRTLVIIFVANCLLVLSVKGFWKSNNIWRRNGI